MTSRKLSLSKKRKVSTKIISKFVLCYIFLWLFNILAFYGYRGEIPIVEEIRVHFDDRFDSGSPSEDVINSRTRKNIVDTRRN